jgi:hypothetical protein
VRLIINLQDVLHGELRVSLRRGKAFVTEHLLDRAQVGTFFEQMRTKGVAQGVWMNIG